ncbi:hypothetical protein AV521_34015 [Streptomyces sp. IMTB 2501]|nr:hypothetical protein AV521_34015 [Streptomyces sp. IMTB 2501]
MHRLATGSGGADALLAWLARRSGGWAGLLDAGGAVLRATARGELSRGQSALVLAAEGAALLARGAGSARIDDGGRTGLFVTTGSAAGDPVLALVVPTSEVTQAPRLIADAAGLVGLCLRAEEAERHRRRSKAVDAQGREAVLHLLMAGDVATARRTAEVLRPSLPRAIRFCVVEGPAGQREEFVRRWLREVGDQCWIVPCPVYARHLLVIAPDHSACASPPGAVPPGEPMGDPDVPQGGCSVGVSGVLPLQNAALGYEQAFHALAAARSVPGRFAVFGVLGELAPLLGRRGVAWAERLLRPLIQYVPARRPDPGSAELLATLESWLSFGGAATRHLKVHRNTLAARLDHIEKLLGLALDRLPGQACAHLALRLRSLPVLPGPEAVVSRKLDTLLAGSTAENWAEAFLRPLAVANPTTGLTVRTWLAHDARLAPTAVALGITAPAVRKRLARAELLLQRSLQQSPSARYDLWLAHHIIDRANGEHG